MEPMPVIIAVPNAQNIEVNGIHPLNVEENQRPIHPLLAFYRAHHRWIKTMLAFLLFASICAAVTIIQSAMKKPQRVDGYSIKCIPDSVVALDGSGHYQTVSQEISKAPDNFSKKFYCIYIKSGVYREQIVLDKTNIALVGDGIGKTIITFDGNNATAVVNGDRFLAINITLQNTGGANESAVALQIFSLDAAFYRCSFIAKKSTLYVARKNLFFRDCLIYGSDRIIFGGAQAFFQNCTLRIGNPPNEMEENVITSQMRDSPWRKSGFIFDQCKVESTQGEGRTRMTYLGSPFGQYSRVVILRSYLGGLINPAGWISQDQNATKTVYFGEFNNTGPGADTVNRVKWQGFKLLSSSDAANFNVSSFFEDTLWLSATGIPYW